MTRSEVAKRLGVHPNTVRNLEKAGKLRGKYEHFDHVTKIVYDPIEVEKLAQTWKPTSPRAGKKYREHVKRATEKRAVQLFNEGKKPWDVVEACGYTMSEAAELWRRWKIGPEQLLAEEEAEAVAKAELQWAKELKQDQKRREWLDHTRRLAEIRANGTAPIVLPERGEKP